MSETFVYTSLTDPRAQPLIDELTYEYSSRYADFFAREDGKHEMERYPPEHFQAPGGAFVLLQRGDVVVGGGAFMRYDDVTAEFKRIWTRNGYRRQGIAERVVVELEAQAARQGYRRVYLTTGFRQPEAVGLYLKLGYTPLFDPQADPATILILPFEKKILDEAALAPLERRVS